MMTNKFRKPNEQGQIAKDCVLFDWCSEKHCDNEEICVVIQGLFCNKYVKGVE